MKASAAQIENIQPLPSTWENVRLIRRLSTTILGFIEPRWYVSMQLVCSQWYMWIFERKLELVLAKQRLLSRSELSILQKAVTKWQQQVDGATAGYELCRKYICKFTDSDLQVLAVLFHRNGEFPGRQKLSSIIVSELQRLTAISSPGSEKSLRLPRKSISSNSWRRHIPRVTLSPRDRKKTLEKPLSHRGVQASNWSSPPYEIFAMLLEFLNVREISAVSQVNRLWNLYSQSYRRELFRYKSPFCRVKL